VITMHVDDYVQHGKRWWFRLHEKGGKRYEVPANHKVEAYVNAYLDAAHIREENKSWLFRSLNQHQKLSERPLHRIDVLAMIKRRAKAARLPASMCCHTFRATGITACLEKGGTIEGAQKIAAHESPRTTKLYERRSDAVLIEDVERIASAI
jgi:integrase/recombinase XerD